MIAKVTSYKSVRTATHWIVRGVILLTFNQLATRLFSYAKNNYGLPFESRAGYFAFLLIATTLFLLCFMWEMQTELFQQKIMKESLFHVVYIFILLFVLLQIIFLGGLFISKL